MKHQIIGILEIKTRRGLKGAETHNAWMEAALELLLRAELERIEQREGQDEAGRK